MHGGHNGGHRARGQGLRSHFRHRSKTPSQKGWTRSTHSSPPNTPLLRYPGAGELFSPSPYTTPKLSSAVSIPAYARSSHSTEGVAQALLDDDKDWEGDFQTPHTPYTMWPGERKAAKVNQPGRWRPQEEVQHGSSWPVWTSAKRSLRH